MTDQVDSVSVVTDGDGIVQTRTEYMPYGETWFQEGDVNNAPKYNSQELDKETGYYYYNARHYDGEIARFVTPDDIIDGEYSTQGWNRYMYCHGNPVLYEDPTGHEIVNPQVYLSAAKGNPPISTASKGGNISSKNNVTNTSAANGTKSQLAASLNNTAGVNGGRGVNAGGKTGVNTAGLENGQNIGSNKSINFARHKGINLPIDKENTKDAYSKRDGISTDYGERNGRHHGIDIPAKKGTPINSTIEGKVVLVTDGESGTGYGRYGKTIVIKDNKTGLYVSFSHNDTNQVNKGDVIQNGQQIGTVGNTGNSDGPHVHYEIRKEYLNNTSYVNPYTANIGEKK